MMGLFAAVLTCLLGCAALAVDVANGYVVRGVLQHAVDDAARTAERWSAQVDDAGSNPDAVISQAVAEAVATARRDAQAHGLGPATVVTTALSGSRLRIAARASVRTWFLPVFGISSWLPAASADAVLWASGTPGAPVSPPAVTAAPVAASPAPAAIAAPPAVSAPAVSLPPLPPVGATQPAPAPFAAPPALPLPPPVPPEVNAGPGSVGSPDSGGGAGDPGTSDPGPGDGGDIDVEGP